MAGLRLRALEESPAAFGSRLAEWQGAGDQEARWRGRLAGVRLNLLAYVEESAVGMVSARDPDEAGTAEMISLWVAPSARGGGVGDALLKAVVSWARERGAARLGLCVYEDQRHAIALYARHGFGHAGAGGCDEEGRSERRMILPLALNEGR